MKWPEYRGGLISGVQIRGESTVPAEVRMVASALEPLNKGNAQKTPPFVLCREVVLFQSVLYRRFHCTYLTLQEYFRHISNSETMWTVLPFMEGLKEKARQAGLWNLFLPGVSGFSQMEYAPMAEVMGRCFFASEVFNCNAPDTGMYIMLPQYSELPL